MFPFSLVMALCRGIICGPHTHVTSMDFETFAELCNTAVTFIPEGNPPAIKHSQPSPWQALTDSVSVGLPVLDGPCEQKHILWCFLSASLTEHRVFKVHLSCSECQCFTPIYC